MLHLPIYNSQNPICGVKLISSNHAQVLYVALRAFFVIGDLSVILRNSTVARIRQAWQHINTDNPYSLYHISTPKFGPILKSTRLVPPSDSDHWIF